MSNYQEIFKEQKYFQNNSLQLSVGERISVLKKIKKEILKRQSDITQALKKDFNKQELETEMLEIYPVISEINLICKKLKLWAKKERVPTPLSLFPNRSYIYKEPKGVVLILAPWNYPFQLSFMPLISSISSGNSNILKPSEMTPNIAKVIQQIVENTCPKSVARVVLGGPELSQNLLQLDFNHIFFTGSTKTGKLVMQAASKNLSGVTLELGGKSPAIVDDSADIESTVEKILWAKFMNAGQTCIAPDYIYVHNDIKEEFLNRVKAQMTAFEFDSDSSRKLTHIVNETHASRLSHILQSSIKQGAEIFYGGTVDVKDNFIAPTILTNINWDQEIMQEEIFGPILPVLFFDDIEKVYDTIMARPKPLALYLFSRQRSTIKDCINNTRSGGMCINQTAIHFANHNLPFGGTGDSGIGSYHGKFGFDELSHRKSVLVGSQWNILKVFYPPHTARVQKLFGYFKSVFY